MKRVFYIALLLYATLSVVSCKTEENLYKRKYTDGHYSDFNLHREKGRKEVAEDSAIVVDETKISWMAKLELPRASSLQMLSADSVSWNSSEMLHDHYPLVAEKMDTLVARQMKGDTTWIHDTLPESIETALSGQAMVGVGTVCGLITIAAPESIWFTIIPMIGVPFFLLISLVAAGVAFGKINRGEIDAKYKGAMRLWAICLVANLIIASVVLMHFAIV